MKFSKKLLVGLMSVALMGGVASTLALTYQAANQSTSGNVDSAIYLNWGSEESIDDIENLGPTTYEHRRVTVATPAKSNGVTKIGKITFTLKASDDNHRIDGTTVYISTQDLQQSGQGNDLYASATKLNVNATTGVFTFEAQTTYYLAFIKDTSVTDSDTTKEIGAILNMSLSVVDKTESGN